MYDFVFLKKKKTKDGEIVFCCYVNSFSLRNPSGSLRRTVTGFTRVYLQDVTVTYDLSVSKVNGLGGAGEQVSLSALQV